MPNTKDCIDSILLVIDGMQSDMNIMLTMMTVTDNLYLKKSDLKTVVIVVVAEMSENQIEIHPGKLTKFIDSVHKGEKYKYCSLDQSFGTKIHGKKTNDMDETVQPNKY